MSSFRVARVHFTEDASTAMSPTSNRVGQTYSFTMPPEASEEDVEQVDGALPCTVASAA
jgi:hypothetical protein